LSKERRNRLFKSTMLQSQKRTRQFDNAFNRATSGVRVSKREREKALMELEHLEERHQRSAAFHSQYIEALANVLEENKALMEMQDEYDKEQRISLKEHEEALLKEGRKATKGATPASPTGQIKGPVHHDSFFFEDVLHLDFHSKLHADYDVLLPDEVEELNDEDHSHHHHHHHHHNHRKKSLDNAAEITIPLIQESDDASIDGHEPSRVRVAIIPQPSTPSSAGQVSSVTPAAPVLAILPQIPGTTSPKKLNESKDAAPGTPSTPHRAVRLKTHLKATVDGIPIVDDTEELYNLTHSVVFPNAANIVRKARIYAPLLPKKQLSQKPHLSFR